MESVNVLFGKNVVDDYLVVKMLWQRQLNEYAVDLVVLVELVNQRQQLLLGGLLGQRVLVGIEAHCLASLFLVANVNL